MLCVGLSTQIIWVGIVGGVILASVKPEMRWVSSGTESQKVGRRKGPSWGYGRITHFRACRTAETGDPTAQGPRLRDRNLNCRAPHSWVRRGFRPAGCPSSLLQREPPNSTKLSFRAPDSDSQPHPLCSLKNRLWWGHPVFVPRSVCPPRSP